MIIKCLTTPGHNVIIFSMSQLHFAEIKHSDWMFQVMGLALTNQSASFQHRNVILR